MGKTPVRSGVEQLFKSSLIDGFRPCYKSIFIATFDTLTCHRSLETNTLCSTLEQSCDFDRNQQQLRELTATPMNQGYLAAILLGRSAAIWLKSQTCIGLRPVSTHWRSGAYVYFFGVGLWV